MGTKTGGRGASLPIGSVGKELTIETQSKNSVNIAFLAWRHTAGRGTNQTDETRLLVDAASKSKNADLIVSSGVEWSRVTDRGFNNVAPCCFEVGGAMWCVGKGVKSKIRSGQVFAYAKDAAGNLGKLNERMLNGEGIIKFAHRSKVFAWAFLAMCGERNAFRTEYIGEVLTGIPEELCCLPWILLIPAHRPMNILSQGAGAIKKVATRNRGSFGPFLGETVAPQDKEHRPSYVAHVVNYLDTQDSRKLAVKVFGSAQQIPNFEEPEGSFMIDTYRFPLSGK